MTTYSFSGADAVSLVYFEGFEEQIQRLQSLHTISISVHEGKGQARALGFRGMKGLARGVRTIAGSMIFTVIEDHPLRPLMSQMKANQEEAARTGRLHAFPGWSVDRELVGTGSLLNQFDFNNRIASLIPPFNMVVRYVTESAQQSDPGLFAQINGTQQQIAGESGPRGASLLLRGVEFLDEGLVTSINDIVSEITLSYIAFDYKPISDHANVSTLTQALSKAERDNADVQNAVLEAKYRKSGGVVI